MSRASELIYEINHEFAQLKKDYILYFSGNTAREPTQKREYLEKRIRLMGSITKIKPAEIFQADSLISKVHSHFRLWDTQLERKDNRIQKKLQQQREFAFSNPMEPVKPEQVSSKAGPIRVTDAQLERERVVALYDQYIRMNIKTGSSSQIGFGKFQGFIHSQTSKFQNRGAKAVEFEIAEKEGKVVIKTRKA